MSVCVHIRSHRQSLVLLLKMEKFLLSGYVICRCAKHVSLYTGSRLPKLYSSAQNNYRVQCLWDVIHTHININTETYIHTYIHLQSSNVSGMFSGCLYLWVMTEPVCMYVCMCVCMYVLGQSASKGQRRTNMYVCMYVCMYV